jgi:hypothetical protein
MLEAIVFEPNWRAGSPDDREFAETKSISGTKSRTALPLDCTLEPGVDSFHGNVQAASHRRESRYHGRKRLVSLVVKHSESEKGDVTMYKILPQKKSRLQLHS